MYMNSINRIVAILLGRLGMKPSEALDAYRTLHDSIATQPAAKEEEKVKNTEMFIGAFKQVLESANVPVDTVMKSGKGSEDQCQRCVN
jgi:hypothetical protein